MIKWNKNIASKTKQNALHFQPQNRIVILLIDYVFVNELFLWILLVFLELGQSTESKAPKL